MVTMRDIAREAKVSVGIVSRILNKDDSLSIKEDTRSRVLSVIEQFNYKPRQHSMTKKHTETVQIKQIGLLMSTSQQEEFSDPYYMAIRQGAESQAIESGLSISKVIRANAGYMESPIDLDGLIVVGNIDYSDLLSIFPKMENVVFVDRLPKMDTFDCVVSNLSKAAENLLQYLFKLGHTNIGFIGGRECSRKINSLERPIEYKEERLMAYERVMRGKGFFVPNNIYIGDWTSTGGYQAMKQVIASGKVPSAVVVANDPMSIGVLRALYEANIRVPEDVAIVSFNDATDAAFFHPPLTTVKLYTEEMGRRAVILLSEQLQGRRLPLLTVVPTKLIVRESCGGKPDEHCGYIL